MKKRSKTDFLLCIAVVLCLSQCFRIGDEQTSDVCVSEASSRTITYEADVQAIMSADCLQCHSNPATQGASQPLTTFAEVNSQYATIKDYISRPAGDSKHMPVGYSLEECEIFQIIKYETDGFLEN